MKRYDFDELMGYIRKNITEMAFDSDICVEIHNYTGMGIQYTFINIDDISEILLKPGNIVTNDKLFITVPNQDPYTVTKEFNTEINNKAQRISLIREIFEEIIKVYGVKVTVVNDCDTDYKIIMEKKSTGVYSISIYNIDSDIKQSESGADVWKLLHERKITLNIAIKD
jgi:hypothetical protein